MIRRRLIAALLLLAPAPVMAQSTIDPTVPANGAALSSAPIRSNFARAFADINALYGLVTPYTPVNKAGDTMTGALTIGGSSPAGMLNVRGLTGGFTTLYLENPSAADDEASPMFNTPTYLTLSDRYAGTRGANHGNIAYAGDGNGAVIQFNSWTRTSGGRVTTSMAINGGLQSAAAGAECSDMDFNGYWAGTYQGLLGINACYASIIPTGDIQMDLGTVSSSTGSNGQPNGTNRRFRDGFFGRNLTVGSSSTFVGPVYLGSTLVTQPATPATATSPCVAGQIAVDATYIYTCVATNSWHRTSNGAAW